mmetsp:Transcript_3711/g.7043  ORF Transcript_3711/g.7043 Transcript_3711/m.7043 type:complete len:179 (-) Transcript_3711:240-776(-)
MSCTSGNVTATTTTSNSNSTTSEDQDELTSTKLFMINHIRDVNFPAKVLVLYIIFSLITKNSIQDNMSRYLLFLIAALCLFGLYVYTHMWRNDSRIAMFYDGEFDTLGVSPDNVLLIFGFVYVAFILAFWWIAKTQEKANKQLADTEKAKGKRTVYCVYFLLAWALILGIHHFWAFFG